MTNQRRGMSLGLIALVVVLTGCASTTTGSPTTGPSVATTTSTSSTTIERPAADAVVVKVQMQNATVAGADLPITGVLRGDGAVQRTGKGVADGRITDAELTTVLAHLEYLRTAPEVGAAISDVGSMSVTFTSGASEQTVEVSMWPESARDALNDTDRKTVDAVAAVVHIVLGS